MQTIKRLAFIVIGLSLVFALLLSLLFSQHRLQKKIALSFLPSGSALESVQIDHKSIAFSQLSIPLGQHGSLAIARGQADYSWLQSISNQRLQLSTCQIEALKVTIEQHAKAQAPTQRQLKSAAAPRLTQARSWMRCPPLAIDHLSIAGQLRLLGAWDSSFRLESSQIGAGRVGALQLTASTRLAKQLGVPMEVIATQGDTQFIIGDDGFFHFQQANFNCQADGLKAIITLAPSLAVKDCADWSTDIEYLKATTIPFKLGDTPLKIEQAYLTMAGRLEPNLQTTITDAQLQLLTDRFGSLHLQSLQTLKYPRSEPLSGPLGSVRIPKIALTSLQPWLPADYKLQSDATACHLILSAGAEHRYELKCQEPITWPAVSLTNLNEQVVASCDSVVMSPHLSLSQSDTLKITIPDFQINQTGTALFEAQIEATKKLVPASNTSITAQFSLAPQALTTLTGAQQLHNSGTICYESASAWPLSIATRCTPANASPDDALHIQLQAGLNSIEKIPIRVQCAIGTANAPTSELTIDATLKAQQRPLKISANIDSPHSQWSDCQKWIGRFTTATPASPKGFKRPWQQKKAPPAAPAAAKPAPWAALDAEISTTMRKLTIEPRHQISELYFETQIDARSAQIDALRAQLNTGTISGVLSSHYSDSEKPHYRNYAQFNFDNFAAQDYLPKNQSWQLNGAFSGEVQIKGEANDWRQAWTNGLGRLSATSRNGHLELLALNRRKSLGFAGAELLGFGLSALLDKPEIHTKTQAGIALIPYFSSIHYDSIEFECVRDTPEFIDLSQLRLQSSTLRVEGSGAVGAHPIQNLLKQPLICELSIASKGSIVESLEVLDLLAGPADSDHYFTWKPRFEISGSLAQPNTDSFSDFLQQESRKLLSLPSQHSAPQKPKIDLKNGIDVLEQLFSL